MKKYLPVLTIAIAAMLVSTISFSQNPCFLPQARFMANRAPVGSTTGDFNEDGKMDIATANQFGTISILLGTGTGSFGAPNNINAGTQPYGIATADFNGDTTLDIVITNLVPAGLISVFIGVGDGTFGALSNYTVNGNPRAIAVGDFNHDAILDLAVTSSGLSTISVLLGNGNGTFANAVNYPCAGVTYAIAIGDFNHDLNPDLAVANESTGNASIFLGNGFGGFAAAVNYPVGTNPYGIAIADFNLDGNLDFCTANNASNDISILLGAGNGTFGSATNFPLLANSSPRGIETADFNSDGKKDIVCTNYGLGSTSVLLGNGAGSFGAVNNFPIIFAPNFLSVRDFNADGKEDIVVVNQGDTSVSVLINNAPTVTLNTTDTLCLSNGAVTLSGGIPIGGIYSGTGVSAGIFDPAVSGIGNFVINYSYSDLNGCQSNANQQIHVDVCTDISETKSKLEATIFPNPTNGISTIEMNSTINSTASIKVINNLGQVVLQEETYLIIGKNEFTMDFTKLTAGIYFIQITTNEIVSTKMIDRN